MKIIVDVNYFDLMAIRSGDLISRFLSPEHYDYQMELKCELNSNSYLKVDVLNFVNNEFQEKYGVFVDCKRILTIDPHPFEFGS